MEHSVRFAGVSTRSLYIEPASAKALFAIEQCRIVNISPCCASCLSKPWQWIRFTRRWGETVN